MNFRKRFMSLLAALVVVAGVGLVGAQGAYAADNVDRSAHCVIPGDINVRIHTNWDNTAGGNGAVLDYWSTKTDFGITSQQFRVNYYTGGWSAWTTVNMDAPNGPNWYGRIDQVYDGIHYYNMWVHQHGYDNRYSVEIKTIWSGNSCTVALSPYWL